MGYGGSPCSGIDGSGETIEIGEEITNEELRDMQGEIRYPRL